MIFVLACVRISFEVPQWHPTRKYTDWRQRKDYWEDRGHRVFSRESLVAIYHGDNLLRFGIVEWRDEEIMAKGLYQIPGGNLAPRPVVGISFLNIKDLESTLQQFNAYQSFEIVQVPVSLFAYTPILGQLQHMATIPFEQELTTETINILPPTYIQSTFRSFVQSLDTSGSDRYCLFQYF